MRVASAVFAILLVAYSVTSAYARDSKVSRVTVVDKDMVVGKDDTLRLLPGAKLRFKDGVGIIVYGTLDADGGKGVGVTLGPAAKGVKWSGVRAASGGSIRLHNVSIKGAREAVRVAGGRLTIASVNISGCEKGVIVEMMAEATVSGLKTRDIGKSAFSVRQDSRASLKDCSFDGPGDIGLSVTGKCGVTAAGVIFDRLDCGVRASYPGASPELSDCVFTNGKYGVFAEYPDASPKLVRCRFSKNTYGVYSKKLSSPSVEACEVSGNEYGVYVTEGAALSARGSRITGNRYGVYVTFSSYPKVNGCDLSGNSVYAAYLDEQSYDWVNANGDAQRRQQMGMRAMAAGQRGSQARQKGMDAARYVNPKGGYVDFQGNYWGEQAGRDMTAAAGLAQVGTIYDYFDKESDIYEGKRYIRDKVDYSGYLPNNPVD